MWIGCRYEAAGQEHGASVSPMCRDDGKFEQVANPTTPCKVTMVILHEVVSLWGRRFRCRPGTIPAWTSCLLHGSDRLRVEASGEVPRGKKMLYSGTDPVSYITEYISVNEG